MAELLLLALAASLASHLVGAALAGNPGAASYRERSATAAALGLGALFVLPAAAALAFLTARWLLIPYALDLLDTLALLLWTGAVGFVVAAQLQRLRPDSGAASPGFLLFLTANCAVLGSGFVRVAERRSVLDAVAYGLAAAVAYALMHVLLALLDERVGGGDVPQTLRGAPITLLAAALAALACAGLGGLGAP